MYATNMNIRKPQKNDIEIIRKILSQWTEKDEVEKYIERILNEINNKIEFNTRFWVITDNAIPIGVGGISEPLPKVKYLSKGNNPAEIKILYLDNNSRGKGAGKKLLVFLENVLFDKNHDEIIIRSAEKYKDTAYGFYEKFGYKLVDYIDNNMAVFIKSL